MNVSAGDLSLWNVTLAGNAANVSGGALANGTSQDIVDVFAYNLTVAYNQAPPE